MLSWLGHAVEFYSEWDNQRELMGYLGVDCVSDATDAIAVGGAYANELATYGVKSRLEYVCEFLDETITPQRPQKRIPDTFDWLPRQLMKMGKKKKKILLCPQTHFQSRAWLPGLWHALYWELKGKGYAVSFALETADNVYASCKVYAGLSFDKLVALCDSVDLVVGVDSFPVHLKGALGNGYGLALMGPTKGSTVFGYCADVVHCLNSTVLPCVGCHFGEPMGASCAILCRSLATLTVGDVTKKISEMI